MFFHFGREAAGQAKFRELYDKYIRLMYYIARKYLRDERDAEDAVQEALLAVHKNLTKISSADAQKTRAFIVTIVERKAIDVMRRNLRNDAVSLDERSGAGFAAPEPGDGGLGDAVSRLEPELREAIYLRYCGYGAGETAELLGISRDAVYRLIKKAKARLAELLEEDGADE